VTLLARDETTSATLAGSRENARHLPGIQLPVEVEATADPTAIADAHELVVMAVPASAIRSAAERIAEHLHPDAVLLSVTKGLEQGTLLRMTEVRWEQ
jgi:glycerol-3-phosphate dehydrogenase (NAD(P)+)